MTTADLVFRVALAHHYTPCLVLVPGDAVERGLHLLTAPPGQPGDGGRAPQGAHSPHPHQRTGR